MREKLEWFAGEAPAGSGALWLAYGEDEGDAPYPIGGIGFGPRDWIVSNTPMKVGLAGDLAILPRHRSLGPALGLVREAMKGLTEDTAFGYCFPNDRAAPIFRRLGWRQVGVMTRYACPLRFERQLAQRLGGRKALAKLGAAVLDVAMRGWLELRARITARRYRLTTVTEPDSRFDELWDRARHDYTMLGRRDAAFLHWRFNKHPKTDCSLLAMVPRDSSSTVAGYAVVESASSTMQMRDVFAPKALLPTLIELVLLHATRKGFPTVSCNSLPESHLSAVLLERGFSAREDASGLIVTKNAKVPDAAEWHVTKADEDT
jgi:hypothetical protein